MKPILSLLTGAALLAGTAAAQASDWDVVADDSTLGFSFEQYGKTIEGRFETWDADITFDPADLGAAKATVTVDIASISTGDGGRDRDARGGTWFDTGEHPTAVFETTGFEATGEGTYTASATLTIRGESQDVALPFTLTITGDTAEMTAETTIDRTAFGVGQGEFRSGDAVSTDVTVTVDLTATRAE